MVNELSERISSEINFENQFFYTKQVTKESRKNRETSKKKKNSKTQSLIKAIEKQQNGWGI